MCRLLEQLEGTAVDSWKDDDALCVGIRRAGHFLGETLGWLPEGRSICPHAKRIPYEKGLLVGLSQLQTSRRWNCLFLVEGAIATGATIISVVQQLRMQVESVAVCAVHAPLEGIEAIVRYCDTLKLPVSVSLAHATTGMNSKYYAVDPNDPCSVVIGDTGDLMLGAVD